MGSLLGFVSTTSSRDTILEGLERLKFRRYDSVGCAFISSEDGHISYAKIAGSLDELSVVLQTGVVDGCIGMGHMRWATHSEVSDINAHPHFDCTKNVAIAHDGVIENAHELSVQLRKKGHAFHSRTDSEVIPHLLEAALCSKNNVQSAVADVINQLEGTFACIGLMQNHPDMMIAIRKRSPLCIGFAGDTTFVSSDPYAFAQHTNQVLFMPDESFALITAHDVQLYDFAGKRLKHAIEAVDVGRQEDGHGTHDHHMLNEIFEQRKAIEDSVEFYQSISKTVWKHIGVDAKDVSSFKTITLIGSGTSWHAARIAQFFFETICGLPTRVYLASEFKYMPFFPETDSLYVVVSQSGETIDAIEALRVINAFDLPTVALTNVASSTLVREAGGFLLTQSGPEVAVASTKAFTTQIAALYWFAHRIACERGVIAQDRLAHASDELRAVSRVLEKVIDNHRSTITHTSAPLYAQAQQFIFLGRHITYPLALEAALKLKEVSYIFAQSYPAGELKHGPFAIVDPSIPITIFSHPDPVIYARIVAGAQEIKERSGHIIAFLFEDQTELAALADTVFVVPQVNPLLVPLAMAGLMQFFVYQIAKERGCPIDKPRNLAKSVTKQSQIS